MKRFSGLRARALPFALAAALFPATALAHSGQPVTETSLQAGPYRLEVATNAAPRADQPIPITITPPMERTPMGYAPEPVALAASLRPAPGTNAVAIAAKVRPDPDREGAWAIDPSVPVRGDWVLDLQVDGNRGSGAAKLPLSVAGPAPIPLWLGWAIGLSPLVGVAAFGVWQGRWLRGTMGNGR